MTKLTAATGMNERPEARGYLGLLALVTGLAVGGFALHWIAGPPRLPALLPSWDVVLLTLRGSSVPYEAIAYVLGMSAWLLWIWMVASLAFRLLVVTAEQLTDGAAWVVAIRAISDRFTMPIVRHMVDGALVALFVANLLGRAAPNVAAAPLTPDNIVVIETAAAPSQPGAEDSEDHHQELGAIEYIVQPGDTLWNIAQRFYGTGVEFPRLVEANAGRQMPDGRRFTQQGVIHPGWLLLVPLASEIVDEMDGDRYYTVQPGDTLSGIAARFLGTESRWRDIFELNHGVAELKPGRVLRAPDLIWPGLRLQLPPANSAGQRPVHAESETDLPTPEMEEAAVIAPVDQVDWALGSESLLDVDPTSAPPAAMLEPSPSPGDHDPGFVYGAAAGVAAAAVGAALVLRRRARRSLDEPPVPLEPMMPERGDFAEAELTRTLTHQLHAEAEDTVTLLAEQACRFFAENGLHDVHIVTAQEGRAVTTLTFTVSLGDQAHLLELGTAFAARLGGKAVGSLTADHDVALRITEAKLAGVLSASLGEQAGRLCLLPLGVLPSSQHLYANWHELGHMLVSGLPGSGTDVILTSVIGALASRRSPEDLKFWTIARPTDLAAALDSLPHQAIPLTDLDDRDSVEHTLGAIRSELVRRMDVARRDDAGEASPHREPELVVVVGELSDLGEDDATTLDMIGVHGAANGIRLLCITTDPASIEDDLLVHFGTRLVLQSLDEEESVRLVGQPLAACLDHGELLVQVEGRTPLRARGFRISASDLEALVTLMGQAHGNRVGEIEGSGEEAPGTDTASDDEAGSLSTSVNAVQLDEYQGELPLGPIAVAKTAAGDGQAQRTAADPADAPIQVRCFGDFEVRHGEQEITAVLEAEARSAHKSFELLAFLACHPDGTAGREKLLAALWPDSPEDRAIASMRTVMSRLRSVLSQQVPGLGGRIVGSDRDGMCRLDTAVVWSDVHEFLALCRPPAKASPDEAKAALQRAISLYRGNLFGGRASRLYAWAEERGESGLSLHESYREEHNRATQRLARILISEGKSDQATPLLRGLLKVEPTLEDVVRDLYCCYQQSGDLTALIREDRQLRQALQQAFGDPENPDDTEGYQPEAETVELFNQVREKLEKGPLRGIQSA